MKTLIAAAALAFFGMQVEAKTLTYEYTGYTLDFAPGFDTGMFTGNETPSNGIYRLPGFKVRITIDTAKLPGGLSKGIDWEGGDAEEGFDPLPDYIVEAVEAGDRFTLQPFPDPHFIKMTFANQWTVSEWNVGMWADYYLPAFISSEGDTDFHFSLTEENHDYYRSKPGRWRLVEVNGVAPVPLPASAPLLLGALFGLAALRRRRSVKNDDSTVC